MCTSIYILDQVLAVHSLALQSLQILVAMSTGHADWSPGEQDCDGFWWWQKLGIRDSPWESGDSWTSLPNNPYRSHGDKPYIWASSRDWGRLRIDDDSDWSEALEGCEWKPEVLELVENLRCAAEDDVEPELYKLRGVGAIEFIAHAKTAHLQFFQESKVYAGRADEEKPWSGHPSSGDNGVWAGEEWPKPSSGGCGAWAGEELPDEDKEELVGGGPDMQECVGGVAGSSGALSKNEKRSWVAQTIESVDLDMMVQHLPICHHFIASKRKDPMTGKLGRECRQGPHCKKLHIWNNTIEERTKAPQKYNLAHVSLYTTSTSSEGVQMLHRPPLFKALEGLWRVRFKLKENERVPIARIQHTKNAEGREIVILHMQDQKQPCSTALSANLKEPSTTFDYVNDNGEPAKVKVSGARCPKIFSHGTDKPGGMGILESRCVKMGTARPYGSYVYPCDDKEIGRWYESGFVFVVECNGCLVDMQKWHELGFADEMVPRGMKGFLRKSKNAGPYQYVCHADGVKILEARVDLHVLVQILAEELDKAGYSQAYHEAVTLVKNKYTTGNVAAQPAQPAPQARSASSSRTHTAAPPAPPWIGVACTANSSHAHWCSSSSEAPWRSNAAAHSNWDSRESGDKAEAMWASAWKG
jgi:hypothetical protein